MDKEFVPYEIALALKELGFTEVCYKMSEHRKSCKEHDQPGGCQLHNLHCGYPDCTIDKTITPIGIPLYQQAFRWFREKYDLYHFVTREVGINTSDIFFVASYYKGKKGNSPKITTIPSKTYEEAELECMKKLIEIVKSQKTKSIT